MRLTWPALVALLLLSAGCVTTQGAVPDQRIPHRLARDAKLYIWVRDDAGKLREEKVQVFAGWWIASPAVVEGSVVTPEAKP